MVCLRGAHSFRAQPWMVTLYLDELTSKAGNERRVGKGVSFGICGHLTEVVNLCLIVEASAAGTVVGLTCTQKCLLALAFGRYELLPLGDASICLCIYHYM